MAPVGANDSKNAREVRLEVGSLGIALQFDGRVLGSQLARYARCAWLQFSWRIVRDHHLIGSAAASQIVDCGLHGRSRRREFRMCRRRSILTDILKEIGRASC